MKNILISIFIIILAGNAFAREQISIVGSSTVYPFTTIVAEKFAQQGNPAPIVESTGSGGGMKLFCAGIGLEHPDITNASRAIKEKEAATCNKNGVAFTEFVVGNDGLAFSNSNEASSFSISIAHIAAALAKELPGGGINPISNISENKLMTWDQVDTFVASTMGTAKIGLPVQPISIMVPPPTSGTRDAMGSLFMKNGWKKLGLYSGDTKSGYKVLREDGVAIEMGENDNLIVEKLAADPVAFGVFGYSFFDTNRDKIQASVIDGVELNFDNIASYKYPGARPLFFYVKNDHISVIPGMMEFMEEFISEKAMSIDGYLFPAGLVPLSDEDFAKQQDALASIK
jgi:phosphate transport system substrate-binding protein